MSGHKSFNTLRERNRRRRAANPAMQAHYEQERAAAHLITALGQLRDTLDITQADLAERLEVTQANISRIERQHDVYLSTLRRYVEALGGHLEVAAVFGEQSLPLTIGSDDAASQGAPADRER